MKGFYKSLKISVRCFPFRGSHHDTIYGAFTCYGNYGEFQKPTWKMHMNTFTFIHLADAFIQSDLQLLYMSEVVHL